MAARSGLVSASMGLLANQQQGKHQAPSASTYSGSSQLKRRQRHHRSRVSASCAAVHVASTCGVFSHCTPERPKRGRTTPATLQPHDMPLVPSSLRSHDFLPSRFLTSRPTNQRLLRRGRAVPPPASFSASASAAAVSFSALEEEFSSGGRVAQGLFGRYRRVVQGGYMDNLKDFARAGIIVYALGWTEEGLRREMVLQLLQDSPNQTLPPPFPRDLDPGSSNTTDTENTTDTQNTTEDSSTFISAINESSSTSVSAIGSSNSNSNSASTTSTGSSSSSSTTSASANASRSNTESFSLSDEGPVMKASDEGPSNSSSAVLGSTPQALSQSQPESQSQPQSLSESLLQPQVQSSDGQPTDGTSPSTGAPVPTSGPPSTPQPPPGACLLDPAVATKQELEECLLWLSLIFVTLRCLPPHVVRRWSDAAPVSADFLLQWRGFCTILTNAYYTHGMAWYSIRRLQMEQLAVTGEAEPSALVADRMRLIFTTLEAVDPRWGGLKDYPTL